MMRVSVVVPTFKRPMLLARCLEALLAQDFASIEYEVIIVDDAVSDQTRCQVEQYAKRAEIRGHTIRYFAATNSHGPAAARNIGLYASYGEIIAFTDDDCIPSPGWLKGGVMALTDDVVAVAGHIIVPLLPAPTDYEYNASSLAYSEFVTANCFVRRSALISIGGFDERFTAAWREDSDLIFTLQELGAHCIAAQDAVILYRQKIQATPPWHYYAIVCALLVIMIGAISESLLLVCIALGTWIYLTCRFCLERLQYTSHTPSHITEMIVTSFMIPLLAIFWRLRGAIKFRVFFL